MSKPNPERLRRTEKIQALLKSGKSRQEVTEILGVSLATVDRARIGMDRLPKGGRRPGSGRPATGAKPLLRKAISQDLLEWLETKPAGFLEDVLRLEVTQETSKGQIRDHPPTVPELSDLEGVRSVFLELQRLIRENRRIRWSWNDFEQASAAETVEMLEQAGFPNWAQCWWDLVMSYERSQPAGFEVRQNLNITRGLWMKESLRRGLYGRAGEQTSQ